MRILLFALGLTLIQACSDPDPLKALERETMAIHDEAMPKIATINRNGRLLKQALADSTHASQKASLITVIALIDKADEHMSDWMRNSCAPENITPEALKTFLEAQKASIQENHREIKDALAKSDSLIQLLQLKK